MSQEDLLGRDAVLERLRLEVERARESFESAKREHQVATERMRDLGMTHPDGSIRHATKIYTFTLQRYKEALNRYNRFILDR